MVKVKGAAIQRTIFLHVNVIRLGLVDTAKQCYDADVVIRARWKEPTIQKMKLESIDVQKMWNPEIFIENAVEEPKVTKSIMVERIGSETFVIETKRFKGSFVEIMKLGDFPFDEQDLSIVIKSDSPLKETTLVEDPGDIPRLNRTRFLDQQEFYLEKFIVCSIPPLNVDAIFGFVKQTRPSFMATIRISRLVPFYIWNVFALVNLLLLLSFSTFAIEVTSIPNRQQASFVLVLTCVTLQHMIKVHVPPISYFTCLDKYMVVISVLLTLMTIWHSCMTRVKRFKTTVDDCGCLGLAVFCVTFNICFIFWVRLYMRRQEVDRKKLEEDYEKRLSAKLKEMEEASKNRRQSRASKA